MRNGKTAYCIGAAAGMLILIMDGRTALAGAQDGISLCIRTLIPSLFPYLVLSAILTGALVGQPLKLLRPIGKLTGMPMGTESLLAVGLLGGYPAGAMNIAVAYRSGQLTEADARRLLPFCNNAGPAFLFGIIAPLFSQLKTAWLLWGIHILSALLVGIVTAEQPTSVSGKLYRGMSLTDSLEHGVRVMGMICGWVVLFRILLSFLERWFLWLLPQELQVLLCGILELSNGCVQLGRIPNEGLRFVTAGTLLSLGGVCVSMQTASAASGLSMKRYYPAKLLQCCFSFLLCLMLQVTLPHGDRWQCSVLFLTGVWTLTLFLAFCQKRNKKMGSIPGLIGV